MKVPSKVASVLASDPEALSTLWAIESRHPGLGTAIAMVGLHESGFNPAKSGRVVKSGRVLADPAGLLQWIPSTAAHFGVTGGSAAILAMSLTEQLKFAERYSIGVLGRRAPTPWALWFAGWGGQVSDPNAPDSAVMYPPGSMGSLANPAMVDGSGAITVGVVRRHWAAWASKVPMVEAPPMPSAVGKVKASEPSGQESAQ